MNYNIELSSKALKFIIEALEFRIKHYKESLITLDYLRLDNEEEILNKISDIDNDSAFLEAINSNLKKVLNQTIYGWSQKDLTILQIKLTQEITFDDLITLGKLNISDESNYIFNRILELRVLCEEDSDEISLESLRTLLFILTVVSKISRPTSITVSENGLFYVEWETSRNKSITLCLKEHYLIDYVIMVPDSNKGRHILNGQLQGTEFLMYLSTLNTSLSLSN